ncbi:hypothetical protein EGW08_004108 [Elysia chlorotica]|uniref:UmuC domain-containing protein n=1 Tax=Elysia chlorotica TaxID=188477 RepID=A0A3S1BH19_ELYCH|nr:hypothetical protein EGW08_004108 [Elysia chlorotica]
MVDYLPDYDFDGEDWTKSFESDCFEEGNFLTEGDFHSSATTRCLTTGKAAAKTFGHERTIIHFDLDCFYAQVEMLKNPELRLKPLGIQQKNIVVTCNYVAREFGVTKLMYVTDAKKKCPQLVLVSGEDLTEYRHMSYQISEFMKKYTPHVERLGFDENFVDATELVNWRQLDGDFKLEFFGQQYKTQREPATSKCLCGCEQRIQIGSQVAADIREALQKELGITSCAGIAHNKVLAKLVAGTHKPNQQTSILPHQVQDLILSLPSPRCIPGIGSKMHKRLLAIGISSVLDLQSTSSHVLAKELGSQTATLVSQLSFGLDPSPVVPYSPPQTFSDEDSFKCCNNYKDAEQRIRDLLNNLMKRVTEDGRVPQTVRLSIRRVGKHSNSRESRQTAVPSNAFVQFHATGSTNAAEKKIFPVVMELLKRLVNPTKPFHLTLINICFAKLVEKATGSSPLSRFFSKQSTSYESCDQQIEDDDNSMKDTIDQQTYMSDSDCSNINDLSHEDRKRKKTNVNSCQSVYKNTMDVPGKMESRINLPAVVTYESNTSDTSFFHLEVQNTFDASSKTTPSVPTCSLNHKESSFCVSTNISLTSQNGIDLKDNIGNPSEETEHDISSVAENSTKPDIERKNKFQDQECNDLMGEKQLDKKSLQGLLPKSIDAQVLLALPCSLQKEILAEHGILMEETSNGRHFSLMPDSVLTRAQVKKKARKRPLFSPKKIKPSISFSGSKTAKKDLIDPHTSVGFEDHEEVNASNSNTFTGITPSADTEVGPEIKASKDNTAFPQNVKRLLLLEPKSSPLPEGVTVQKSLFPFAEVESELKAENFTRNKNLHQKSALSLEKSPCATKSLFSQHPTAQKVIKRVELPPKSSAGEICELYDESSESCVDQAHKYFDQLSKVIPSSVPSGSSLFDENQNNESNVNHAITQASSVTKAGPVSSARDSVQAKRTPLLPESILKKLPKDISSEVFAELPSDIRGEIMAHVLMGTPITVAMGSSTCGAPSNRKPSSNLSNSKRSKNSKSSQKSLFNYFKRNEK